MLLWRKQNPDADPSAYNREWDSVYLALKDEFSDKEDGKQSAFAKAFEEEFTRLSNDDFGPGPADRRVIVELHHRPKKPRRPRETHAPTKGAFGKPKIKRRR